jgi:hypothetical protein
MPELPQHQLRVRASTHLPHRVLPATAATYVRPQGHGHHSRQNKLRRCLFCKQPRPASKATQRPTCSSPCSGLLLQRRGKAERGPAPPSGCAKAMRRAWERENREAEPAPCQAAQKVWYNHFSGATQLAHLHKVCQEPERKKDERGSVLLLRNCRKQPRMTSSRTESARSLSILSVSAMH